jgi:aspartate/methionine/tyrosine aminotransferase
LSASAEFVVFEMEQWQSLHEHDVRWNLADSAVRCAPLELLLGPGDLEELGRLELFYPEVNGTELLRARIAATYDPTPATGEVLVTVGAAEANALVCQTLLEPGDRVVVIEPGYRQVRGIAENLGCEVVVVQLRAEDGWELDLDELRDAVTPGTKLLSITNPNNPTGTILSDEAAAAVLEAVERSGCWLHADEVYCGSEHDGRETPSFWGRHPRTVCVNSLSKAYGLCGLRVGWLVAPEELAEACRRRHEYAVISTSLLGVVLAERALEPAKRAELLARQRELVRDGAALYAAWLDANDELISAHPSAATALSFPRVAAELPSVDVADAIRRDASVLTVPGSMLGAEGHLRLTVGFERDFLQAALAGVANVLRALDGRSAE